MGKQQITFQDFIKNSKKNDHSEEEDEIDSKRQNFYAGSGQNIVGSGDRNENLVASILNTARTNAEQKKQASEEKGTFIGKSRTLFDEEEESEKSIINNGKDKEKGEITKMFLVFWKDGFSIMSPKKTIFYPSGDVKSERMLKNINSGIAPLKELGLEPGQDIDIAIDDSLMGQPYDEKVLKRIAAFLLNKEKQDTKPSVFDSGIKGNTLSSSTNKVLNSSSINKNEENIIPEFPVIDNLPTTRIQLRFNGKR